MEKYKGLQTKAFYDLFIAILEENGYYENLRSFARKKYITEKELAKQLNGDYSHNAPEGISVYWYMDTLEDVLADMDEKDWKDCDDIFDLNEIAYNKMAWKTY